MNERSILTFADDIVIFRDFQEKVIEKYQETNQILGGNGITRISSH